VNPGGEQAAFPIVGKVDIRLFFQCPFDPRAEAVIGQKPLGHERNQNRVADIGHPSPDFLHRQVVGQVTGADDLDAVVEDKRRMVALTR